MQDSSNNLIIREIEPLLYNQVLGYCYKNGWKKKKEYDNINVWLDHRYILLSKGNELIEFEWSDFDNGSILSSSQTIAELQKQMPALRNEAKCEMYNNVLYNSPAPLSLVLNEVKLRWSQVNKPVSGFRKLLSGLLAEQSVDGIEIIETEFIDHHRFAYPDEILNQWIYSDMGLHLITERYNPVKRFKYIETYEYCISEINRRLLVTMKNLAFGSILYRDIPSKVVSKVLYEIQKDDNGSNIFVPLGSTVA